LAWNQPGSDTAVMSGNNTILLISDRPDRSHELAGQLARLSACRTIELHGDANAVESASAIVVDVDLRRRADIEQLRCLLSKACSSATPILAILRNDSYLTRVQAGAIGASFVYPAGTPLAAISAVLTPAIQQATNTPTARSALTVSQNVEQAQSEFGTIFRAAAGGEPISRAAVDGATAAVMSALADGGIRDWLEIVWTYDDATYQHCMLVTGLAAGFARTLQFAESDQKHLVRGALLHDVGKAKIPHCILNKPGALNGDEMAIMGTHPAIGYELLLREGNYEPELLEVVRWHHELLDGSGYPDGLAGAEIPDLVRLVTICDIYAALIERRPYRPPMEPPRAFKILEEMEGKLERALVRAFAQVAELSAPISHRDVA
jgi:putative nucleotidyltransferase with HDIG domain